MKSALLLSGGIDSIALLYWLNPELAISIDYGQLPAEGEIDASKAVCEATNTSHYVIQANCSSIGQGTMSAPPVGSRDEIVPHGRSEWWPYRNQLLVTLAAAYAMPLGIRRLLIGTVKEDIVHGDGSARFVHALSETLAVQEGGLILDAPAIHFQSAELVSKSGVPPSLLAWSHSCHVANIACGACRGCMKANQILDDVGMW